MKLATICLFFFCVFGQANPVALKIYVPGSYTGIMPFLANGIHRAAVAFANETNEQGGLLGRKIEVISQDDKADVLLAEKEAQIALADPNHLVTIGHSFSSVALPIGRLYSKQQKLFVSPNATNVKISKLLTTVFQLSFNDDFQGKILAKISLNRFKAKRIVVLTNMSDPFSDGISEIFISATKKKSTKVVTKQFRYLGERLDLPALVALMKEAKPDLVFLPELKPRAAEILRDLNANGFGNLVFLGADGWGPADGRPDIFFGDKKSSGGRYFYTYHWHPDMKSRVGKKSLKHFEKLTGQLTSFIADGPAVLSYEWLCFLRNTINKYKTLDNAKLASLIRGKTYEDSTGSVTFANDGETVRNLVLLELLAKGLRFDSVVNPEGI